MTPLLPSVTRLAPVVLLAYVVAGCAEGQTWSPVNEASLRQNNPKRLLVVLRPPQDVLVIRPFTSVVGWSVAGAAVFKDDHLVDPSVLLASELADGLSNRYDLEIASIMTERIVQAPAQSAGRPTVVGPPRPATDLVLEVQTSSVGMGTAGPLAGYRAFYAVSVKLTDSKDGRVLAAGTCGGPTLSVEKEKDLPSYDQMLDDAAALLKSELQRAKWQCRDMFESKLFFTSNVNAPPSPARSETDGGTDERRSVPATPSLPIPQQIDPEQPPGR